MRCLFLPCVCVCEWRGRGGKEGVRGEGGDGSVVSLVSV